LIADFSIGEVRFIEDCRFSERFGGSPPWRAYCLSVRHANIGSSQERDELIDEADQLTAIFTASHKTARRGSS
jgi:hypothetical protein